MLYCVKIIRKSDGEHVYTLHFSADNDREAVNSALSTVGITREEEGQYNVLVEGEEVSGHLSPCSVNVSMLACPETGASRKQALRHRKD